MVASNILIYFYYLSRKRRPAILSESSACKAEISHEISNLIDFDEGTVLTLSIPTDRRANFFGVDPFSQGA